MGSTCMWALGRAGQYVGTRYIPLEAISQQQNKTEHLHNIDISDLAQSSLKLVEF